MIRFSTLFVFALSLLFLSACGSPKEDKTPLMHGYSPVEGSLLTSGSAPVFTVINANTEKIQGLYTFTLYSEQEGQSIVVEQSEQKGENGAGIAVWQPATALVENSPYWWDVKVNWTDGDTAKSAKSRIRLIHVLKDNSNSAEAPENNGAFDVNNASNPSFSVKKAISYTNENISIRFELFSDPALQNMIANGVVPQTNDDRVTWTWDGVTPAARESLTSGEADGVVPAEPTLPGLSNNTIYYWRSRVESSSDQSGWSSVHNFTVKNMCVAKWNRYAHSAIRWEQAVECDQLSHHNTSDALGPPNAHGFIDQVHAGSGFISIGEGGSLIVEMGLAVYDGPGDDIRVYEYISFEPIELLASNSSSGPWRSLGTELCGDSCDYDLGRAGMTYARYIKIQSTNPPTRCHKTAGPDIDSVEILHAVNDPSVCGPVGDRTARSYEYDDNSDFMSDSWFE